MLQLDNKLVYARRAEGVRADATSCLSGCCGLYCVRSADVRCVVRTLDALFVFFFFRTSEKSLVRLQLGFIVQFEWTTLWGGFVLSLQWIIQTIHSVLVIEKKLIIVIILKFIL